MLDKPLKVVFCQGNAVFELKNVLVIQNLPVPLHLSKEGVCDYGEGNPYSSPALRGTLRCPNFRRNPISNPTGITQRCTQIPSYQANLDNQGFNGSIVSSLAS